MGELAGKAAMVLGASGYSLWGRTIALRLAREGADVALHGPPEVRGDVASLAAQARSQGRRAVEACGDPAQASDVQQMFHHAIGELGHLDILVNNVSVVPGGALLDTPLALWEQALHTNLKAAFLGSREGAKYMVRSGEGGKLLYVASYAARVGVAGLGVYCATQFGLVGLAQCAAQELAEHRITVNVLAVGVSQEGPVFPGADARDTGAALLQRWMGGTGTGLGRPPSEWSAALPIAGGVSADDVAEMVAFLVSPGADHVTGQVVDLSGGQLIGL